MQQLQGFTIMSIQILPKHYTPLMILLKLEVVAESHALRGKQIMHALV
jgi:hypothetical protein